MTQWPKDNQAARNAFYGDPGLGQIPSQMVPVVPPFAMYYTDEHGTKRVNRIMFHRKCAPALLAALNEIWDYCGHDQAKVDASGASKYFGAYNHRMVRGSTTKWSNHAYAAAIDLNALENALGKKGTMPQFIVDAFCRQGAMWGGWYVNRPDWMHFEFVDNGGRKPKSPPPGIKPVKPTAVVSAPADDLDDHNLPSFLQKKKDDPVIVDGDVAGDPELYSVQKRLKAMNYNPGRLDGDWGGGTSGALAGFINDRGGHIPAPTTLDAFYDVREQIKAELGQAESQHFTRPVSEARKSGDVATVAAVAPEVVPVRRNFLLTIWAAIGTFFTGLINSISGYISQAWDFFTDHKDDLPSDPSYLSMAWDYFGKVPGFVWFALIAAALGFVALNSWKGMKKITESVQTGARL